MSNDLCMYVCTCLMCFVCSALDVVVVILQAFAPNAAPKAASSLKAASDYEGMNGITFETGNKLFDPLGLTEYLPAKYAREAELSNGRSAMLATVGWFWPQVVGTFQGDDVTTTDPIDAIMQADPQWWAQFVIFCAVIENWKYNKAKEGKSFTGGGEPAIDYMGLYPADAAKRAELEEKELKNARLAMIGFASFVSAHFIPGSVPGLPADFH